MADTREIPVAAIERNRVWIEAMTNALKTNDNLEFSRAAMRETGKQCATQLLEKIVTHFGRTPQSIDEIIEAINKRRREVLQVPNLWQRDGNKASFKLENCGCDLVESGLATPNPIFCLCSAGMFEHLFTPFWKGTVTTQIVKAIGLGDEHCEFVMHFDEEMPLKSREIK
jgi:hypothetical protein